MSQNQKRKSNRTQARRKPERNLRKSALPAKNDAILSEFDLLLKCGRHREFFRQQPDNEHPTVLWDVVGDCERNWLYVVASNPKKKLRFAAVTNDPGGWSIEGQAFGIDAETSTIADELSQELFQEHRAALLE